MGKLMLMLQLVVEHEIAMALVCLRRELICADCELLTTNYLIL